MICPMKAGILTISRRGFASGLGNREDARRTRRLDLEISHHSDGGYQTRAREGAGSVLRGVFTKVCVQGFDKNLEICHYQWLFLLKVSEEIPGIFRF